MLVDHVDLKSGSRGHRPVLDLESLTCALSSESLETKLLSLQLEGWTLDTCCTRLLCQTLKDNDGDGSNANLVGLTLTNCLWQIELEPDLNMIEALESNTTLKKLVFHNTRVPPSFWNKLPEMLSHPTCSLTQLDLDACINGEEMSLLLEALCRAPPSLREISIPILFDNWTEDLLHKLETLLTTPSTSATKKLRKVKFALQAMPSYSLWNKQPENQQRQKVWSVWRNFLASSASASSLQELEASNLSEAELLDLVDIVAAKKHMEQPSFGSSGTGGIQKLYLNNGQGVRLETLTLLLDRLCLCNKTNLQVFLSFTLYNGEELNTRSAARADLTRALTGNHVVETLHMTCGVFSPTAGEDLTTLYPDSFSTGSEPSGSSVHASRSFQYGQGCIRLEPGSPRC